jgi:hypothetical protein
MVVFAEFGVVFAEFGDVFVGFSGVFAKFGSRLDPYRCGFGSGWGIWIRIWIQAGQNWHPKKGNMRNSCFD